MIDSRSWRLRSFLLPAMVLALLAFGASSGHGDYIYWNVYGGSFSTGSNWSPYDSGGPDSDDHAIFSQDDYTRSITFDISPTNLDAVVGDGVYYFRLEGNTYTLSYDLYVNAAPGDTARLILYTGGTMAVRHTDVAVYQDSECRLSVSGSTTSLTNTTSISVGSGGAGTMTVVAGADVTSRDGYLGYSTYGSGTVTVTGSGSTWTNSDGIYVGGRETAAGGAGLLTVENDGFVDAGSTLKVWNSGVVNITTGGEITVGGSARGSGGSLAIGNNTNGALSIVGGGSVSNHNGYVGYGLWGGSGTAVVDGVDSTWQNSGSLYVGYWQPGTLRIRNGGSVTAGTLACLGYMTSSGATVSVEGAGSTLQCSGPIYVARYADAVLDIQDGGALYTSDGALAYDGGTYATVTVDGAGSTWESSGAIIVGEYGTGALNVQNGGTVSNTSAYVSLHAKTIWGGKGTATVDGAGSLWTSSQSLYVGGTDSASGGNGQLIVRNNGLVNVSETLKVWDTATVNVTTGGQIAVGGLVPNDGSLGADTLLQVWDSGRVDVTVGQFAVGGPSQGSGGSLTIGSDAAATLNILSGGNVTNTTGYLGLSSTGVGTATVDGSGSTWTNSGNLYVGGDDAGPGGTGSVTARNGGTLSVGGTLKLWDDGTLEIDGGTVTTSEIDVLAGTFRWLTGTLRVTGPAGLAVAPGAELGDPLTLLNGQTLDVTHELSVASTSMLTVGPGASLSAGSLINEGTTTLLAPATFGAGGVASEGRLYVLTPSVDFGGGLTNTGELILSGTTVDGTVATLAGSTVTVLGTVTFNDLVSGAGTFWGPGTTVFNGDYSPGESPAATTFEGSVVLGATNQLLMELAGLVAGTGYDQVSILGDVTLGGELEVLVDGAFRDLIQGTDTFSLVEAAGAITGEFLNVAPGGLLVSEDGLSQFTVYYGHESPYGAQSVVLSDFVGNSAAIPEPATLSLLALGGLGLLRRRRRIRR